MKYLTILLLLTSSIHAQTDWQNIKGYIFCKDRIAPMALTFAAGHFDGLSETLRVKYPKFKSVWPNASDRFWNFNQSQGNKWKNGDRSQGERFLFSSTALVFLTDGYHLARSGRNICTAFALVIKIGGRKQWYYYVVDLAINVIFYGSGFWSSYEILYK